MFNRVSRYLSAAACALGMMIATGVQADDRDGWRHDRGSQHRGHDRGEWRHHARNDDRRYRDYRAHRGYRNEWRAADYRRDWDRRGWDRRDWHRGRHYQQHRCHDRRHYHRAHFHVPTRYYSRDVYAGFPYHGIYRDRGAEATVVLSFPL
jgi:hypothetical protein